MQGGATRRRVVSHFSTKIPLRRYFSGPAAVGYSLLFVSLLPYSLLLHGAFYSVISISRSGHSVPRVSCAPGYASAERWHGHRSVVQLTLSLHV